MGGTRRFAVIAVILLLVLAACGGTEGSDTTSAEETTTSTTGGGAEQLEGSLVVATAGGRFGDAVTEAWLNDFGEEMGVDVEIDSSAPGGFAAKLMAQAEANNITTNIVDMSEEDAVYLYQQGLIAPLPEDLRARLVEETGADKVTEFGIDFAGYGHVIVCNLDAAEACPETPADFFDTEAFPGRRAMFAGAWWENPLYALEAAGVASDDLFPFDLDLAYQKLDEIKDSIDVWYTSGDQVQQIMRDEEVVMAITWDGRASGLIDQGVNVQISLVGSPLARDLFSVPVDAPDPEVAYAFLEWYATHPEGSARFVDIMHYGVADPEAFDLVSDDITRYMVSSPENADKITHVDMAWLVENRDALVDRWEEWLAS